MKKTKRIIDFRIFDQAIIIRRITSFVDIIMTLAHFMDDFILFEIDRKYTEVLHYLAHKNTKVVQISSCYISIAFFEYKTTPLN